MSKLGIGFLGSTAALLAATPLFVASYPDPLVAFLMVFGIWVFMAITFLFAAIWANTLHRRAAGRMYQGTACNSQLPGYMATQNYFNQQQIRRDLDSIAENNELDHLQNRVDHMQ